MKNFKVYVAAALLIVSMSACNSDSAKKRIIEDYNTAYHDSGLEKLSCETANVLVQKTTGQDYCNK